MMTSLSDFFSFIFNFLRHIDILSFFLSILILCHAFNIFSYVSQDINLKKYFFFLHCLIFLPAAVVCGCLVILICDFHIAGFSPMYSAP